MDELSKRMQGWSGSDLETARLNTMAKLSSPSQRERAQAMLVAIEAEMAARSAGAISNKSRVVAQRSSPGRAPSAEPSYRVARIAYNSSNWTRPTGDAAEQEANDTYNSENGFGHEDWLFRDDWVIDGWRYAFLQGVNASHSKLVRENTPINVTLFTVYKDKRRRYVAYISELECLSDLQAAAALSEFKSRGWLDTMIAEVSAVNGKTLALGDPNWAPHILNVRFRLANVQHINQWIDDDDPVMACDRYSLFYEENLRGTGEWIRPSRRTGRAGQPDAPTQRPFIRSAAGPVECTPEHAWMQAKLLNQLREEQPGAEIVCEADYVDILVRSKDHETLYEIKTDLSPLSVLRQAIGQLLEYGLYGQRPRHENLRFVAVGRLPLSPEAAAYLAALNQRYGLSLQYRVVQI